MSAAAAWATAVKQKQQPSIEDVEDDDSTSANSSPKNLSAILEAANRSDDMPDYDPAPALKDFEDDDDDDNRESAEPVVSKPVKMAEEQRSE